MLALAALASLRAARAITVDEITEPWRKRVEAWSIRERPSEPRYDWRPQVATLVACPHCTGHWTSLAATLAAYRVMRRRPSLLEFGLAWWAVSGTQSLLASVQASMEQKKDEVAALVDIAEAPEIDQNDAGADPPDHAHDVRRAPSGEPDPPPDDPQPART